MFVGTFGVCTLFLLEIKMFLPEYLISTILKDSVLSTMLVEIYMWFLELFINETIKRRKLKNLTSHS